MRWLSGRPLLGDKVTAAPKVIVEKDMGLSHGEFFRTIASALGTDDFEAWDTGVRLASTGKILEIHLGEQGERRIALLAVPRTLVTLEFTGYVQAEVDAAIKRFDMMFKRGGG